MDLFQDGASCRDIVQGALGDCYFLSALSVMVEQKDGKEDDTRVRQVFVGENENLDNWKSTGAFMLRFIKDGNHEFVIVDDFIPVNA